MKTKMIITLVIIVLVVALGYFFITKNKAQAPVGATIVETKEFSWPDNSFSFSYPVFKGWSDVTWRQAAKDLYSGFAPGTVFLDFDVPGKVKNNADTVPILQFEKSNRLAKLSGDTPRNPNGVYYYYGTPIPPGTKKITFQAPRFSVDMTVLYGDKEGFSEKDFIDEIIRTFKAQ